MDEKTVLRTPCYVYDEAELSGNLLAFLDAANQSGHMVMSIWVFPSKLRRLLDWFPMRKNAVIRQKWYPMRNTGWH